MNILILAKVPPEFEKFRKGNQEVPSFQAQYFWKKALKELGHKVIIKRYSDPLYISTKTSSKIQLLLSAAIPKLWQKFRLFKNKFYLLIPQNYIRTNKIRNFITSNSIDCLIVCGGCSEMVPSLFKNKKFRTLLLNGENPLESATKFEKDSIKHFDKIITNDRGHATNWKKMGATKAEAIPYTGVDPNTHKDKKSKRNIDVLFVGTLFKERQLQLAKLTEFNPSIYGYIPKSVSLDKNLKKFYKGEAWGNKVVTLYNRAKIAINFVPKHMKYGGNTRTFRIPACGAVQIADKCPQDWFIDNQEVVLFKNTKDLKKKIKYLLNNSNKLNSIAKKGKKKAHQSHTYKLRFKEILSS